jgi:hypothetical protein
MDENRLTEAFRDAVGDVPLASFDTRDVLVASARATAHARRRTQFGGGVALGVVVLAGGVFAVTALPGGGASSGQVVSSAPALSGSPLSMATNSPQIGTMLPNNEGGGGDTTTPQQCGQPDQGLGTALVVELPAAAGAQAKAADVSCPAGSAGVAFEVTDGTNIGWVEVVLVQPDPVTGKPAAITAPNAMTVRTRSGASLTLFSRPAGGSSAAPYVARLGDIAARLATHY